MNIKDDFILKNINEGYLVGGSVRDFLMNKKFVDRDITIKNAESFAKKTASETDATFIVLDSENQIFRLVLKDKENYLDISELRGESIEEDLLERDFTINAIAYDLKNDKLIDVTGGISDIKNQRIRGIKGQNFIDDPLRILRAYRFMSTTGFNIDTELTNILKKHLLLINNPAKERVHDELIKLFGGDYASKTLLEMYKVGILEILFPCVKEMENIPPNTHHHLGLLYHVIETVRQIEIQYNSENKEVYEHLSKTDFGGYPRLNHLKLAGFLHDIGKYSTWTIEQENGKERHRFIKHDLDGAKIVIPFLKSLKFSNKQIEYISDIIRYHIYPSNVISAPVLDDKVMMRYIRKMQSNVIDNIVLAKADRLSALGEDITEEMVEFNINGLNKLLQFYLQKKDLLKPLPKLLSGEDIMDIKQLKPSPVLGHIIKELHEAQLNGDILTKEDAVTFVENFRI